MVNKKVNVQKGKRGFQKTTVPAPAPTEAKVIHALEEQDEATTQPVTDMYDQYLKIARQRTTYLDALEASLHKDEIIDFATQVEAHGGQALIVGGSVRDAILGLEPKDFDIEVHRLPAQTVYEIAQNMGTVKDVGASFGVYKTTPRHSDIDLDISLPRYDSKKGSGHRGIQADIDPYLGIDEGARRRDFTINAIAYDPLTHQIYDPYHGIEDIENKTLRAVDARTFVEDPLRAVRAIQFAGRFEFDVSEDTKKLMRQVSSELHTIAPERYTEEFRKLFTKSKNPSVGLRLADQTGVMEHILPEITELHNIPQDTHHHPEGDAFEHTMQSADAAARVAQRESLNENETFTLVMSATLHDIGKKTAYERNGTAIGHDKDGAKLAETVMSRLNIDLDRRAKIKSLISNHMSGLLFTPEMSDGAVRRLAKRLHPATINDLALLMDADQCGRDNVARATTMSDQSRYIIKRANNLGVTHTPPENLVTGKDLIAAGLKPGPTFSDIITKANDLRDDFGYDKEQALAILLKP